MIFPEHIRDQINRVKRLRSAFWQVQHDEKAGTITHWNKVEKAYSDLEAAEHALCSMLISWQQDVEGEL